MHVYLDDCYWDGKDYIIATDEGDIRLKNAYLKSISFGDLEEECDGITKYDK